MNIIEKKKGEKESHLWDECLESFKPEFIIKCLTPYSARTVVLEKVLAE